MNLAETWNSEFIDAQYKLWQSDPGSVTKDWQFFFAGFELAAAHKKAAPVTLDAPGGLAVAEGKLYVADTNHHVIRIIDLIRGYPIDTLTIYGLKPPLSRRASK